MCVCVYALSHNKKKLRREERVNNVECCYMLLKKLSYLRTDSVHFSNRADIGHLGYRSSLRVMELAEWWSRVRGK